MQVLERSPEQWEDLLAPGRLSLPREAARPDSVTARLTEDREGEPVLELRVMLPETVGVDDISWDTVGPIYEAIWLALTRAECYDTPLILFETHDDESADDESDWNEE